VEDDLVADPALDEPVGVDHVAVELEAGIVENKVNSAVLDLEHVLGELGEVVAENILLGCGKVVTASRLELLDVLLGHVDEQGKVGRVTPQADWYQLVAPASRADSPWESSWKMSLFFSRRASSDRLASAGWGAENRIDSSNTACEDREKVSHFWRKKTS